MHALLEESAPVASVGDPQADADLLQLRAEAADRLDPALPKKAEATLAGSASALIKRFFDRSPRTALAACLFGFALIGGSYFARLAETPGAETADASRAAQRMAQEISAIKADVEALRAAQTLGVKGTGSLGNVRSRLDAAKAESKAAVAEVTGRVDNLQRESAAKLSQVNERFDRIERQIAELLAVAPVAGGSASGPPVARKRAPGERGDAFDPSQNPNAPGVPRSLGILSSAASANGPAGDNEFGRRTN